MRERMGEAAIRVARSAGYYNAGTVEFLVDGSGDFYFLEMNTRLQVEHPITELATGQDLVRLQMEVAAGEKLRLRQEEITWRGWAIECRICAEDPYNNFFPSPGRITRLTRPQGPGVRLDGCVYEGWTVPIDYDPLLAKLAVWNGTRESAIARMVRALREYDVGGIRTNIGFFRQILEDEEFRQGRLHTGFVDEFLARCKRFQPSAELAAIAELVAAHHAKGSAVRTASIPAARSRWREIGRGEMLR
jgi:acetyl-CoA carboxylase biotin carboxylase subunit